MVSIFGAGMAVHFSPKDLGLSDAVLGIIFGQFGIDCFGQLQDEFLNHRLARVCCLCHC